MTVLVLKAVTGVVVTAVVAAAGAASAEGIDGAGSDADAAGVVWERMFFNGAESVGGSSKRMNFRTGV